MKYLIKFHFVRVVLKLVLSQGLAASTVFYFATGFTVSPLRGQGTPVRGFFSSQVSSCLKILTLRLFCIYPTFRSIIKTYYGSMTQILPHTKLPFWLFTSRKAGWKRGCTMLDRSYHAIPHSPTPRQQHARGKKISNIAFLQDNLKLKGFLTKLLFPKNFRYPSLKSSLDSSITSLSHQQNTSN